MNLRSHQAAAQQIAVEIRDGAPVREIILAVTPGGGKSGVPVILASILIPSFADRLIWVAPRNALKYQGEAEFIDPRWETPRRLRAADGNEPAPDRGTDGYLTTYQAIGISPASHQEYCRKHRTILFLDEPHHVQAGSTWADALAPMIEAAVLVVYASGTFSRGDGQRIHGMRYGDDGLVVLTERPGTRVIRYGRKQAIADGAIIAPQLVTIDGAAKWVSKEGVDQSVSSLRTAGGSRSDAVFTALRTEFAFALLAAAMEHWNEYRRQYPAAKLLVVAPDIETAKTYQSRLAALCASEIATSEETAQARRAIEDFKRGMIDALVTVGMAYEGLSVPPVTHIACLTQIRSVPWLEQMQARANRRATGKDGAWVFAPADEALLEAWKMIEEEALVPLSDPSESRGESGLAPEGFGLKAPQVKPLWSTAHGVEAELPFASAPAIAPSEMERILREQIRAIRRQVVDGARPGSGKALATVWNATVREVADKDLDHMDAGELQAVWMKVRDRFRGRV